jgi:hypothetical protein
MRLHRYDIPVAVSMIELARMILLQPFQEFICYWTAFNNIYTTIADREGCHARLRRNPDGTLKTRPATRLIGNIKMASVDIPKETAQIDLAFTHFSKELKHRLITHENTRFFVYRVPVWKGQEIEFDTYGQKLNGVLNVGYTADPGYPVWSPIDIQLYENCMNSNQSLTVVDTLAEQILYVLYTVRNNLVHGSKAANDANSRDVLREPFRYYQ